MNLWTTMALFLVLPLAAGALVQFSRPNPTVLRLLLAFSGSFLLSVALTHMMPELYEVGGEGIGPVGIGRRAVRASGQVDIIRGIAGRQAGGRGDPFRGQQAF